MENNEKIYFLDQITPKPGHAERFLQYYMDGYAPLARARGRELEHSWVNPPLWLEGEQSNTLFIVWSVKNVAGFWSAGPKARSNPTSSDWWREAESRIATRSRLILSEASNIASLADV